jgi:hypothetical protein
MQNQIEKSRIMITVFREFGIPITGSRKQMRFYSEILVDKFYVMGILFELECRLGVLLEDEDNLRIDSPLDVILSFKEKDIA